MKKVRLEVRASGSVEVEMDEAAWNSLDKELGDYRSVDLEDVPGVDWDDIVNILRFEVDDAEVVAVKAKKA